MFNARCQLLVVAALVACAGLCAAQTPQAVVSIQLYSDESCSRLPAIKSMVGLLTGVCVPNELETSGGYAQWIARPHSLP